LTENRTISATPGVPLCLAAFLHRRDGNAGVEFAFSLPIILVALLGVMEGGRMIYTQAALHFAAQEATRFAVVREGEVTDQELADFAADQLIGFDSEPAVVTVKSPIDSETKTSEFEVTISYEITPMIPYTGGGPVTLSAESSGFVAFDPSVPGGGS